jgi:hypothetical protein
MDGKDQGIKLSKDEILDQQGEVGSDFASGKVSFCY